jgi:hypothetical protein
VIVYVCGWIQWKTERGEFKKALCVNKCIRLCFHLGRGKGDESLSEGVREKKSGRREKALD